jgi:hypothetical protein
MATPSGCTVCGAPLDRRNASGKCRTHANEARAGTRKQSRAARVAASTKWARIAEDRRLASLAREAGLG